LILFCDTSALVKLYIAEDASREMRALAGKVAVVAVSRLAWAEMMAAVARRARELPSDAQAMETVRKRLRADWPHNAEVELTQAIVEKAGEYADTFALRAYDSVQLAAARSLQEIAGEEVQFACFDTRLCKAARTLGMASFP
jgi:predicted nucleic acid-binding protein